MAIHLVKLCVGAEDVDDLAAWQARLMRRYPRPVHHTRMAPRRADELVRGGSIYWVIRGMIRVRQAIEEVRLVDGGDGRRVCELVFDPELVLTEAQPKKPFQGWRYLEPADAPADLTASGTPELPADLGAALRDALVW